jgi:hypothetical protein
MGGGGATAPQVFFWGITRLFSLKIHPYQAAKIFWYKTNNRCRAVHLRTQKKPKHAVYSLQFTVLHATTDRDAWATCWESPGFQPYRVPPGILRGSLLLVTLIGSWSSFCNPCSQSEYRTNRRNLTETCNNSEPASLCFVLFVTAILTRCQLFKTSWCSESRAVRKPVSLANKKPTIETRDLIGHKLVKIPRWPETVSNPKPT